jgi:hypothetical protein
MAESIHDAPWGDWDSLSDTRPQQAFDRPSVTPKRSTSTPAARPEPQKFAKGDRVRHIANKKLIGAILSRAKYRGDWMVKWDNDPSPKDRLVPMYERDLAPEIVDDPGQQAQLGR